MAPADVVRAVERLRPLGQDDLARLADVLRLPVLRAVAGDTPGSPARPQVATPAAQAPPSPPPDPVAVPPPAGRTMPRRTRLIDLPADQSSSWPLGLQTATPLSLLPPSAVPLATAPLLPRSLMRGVIGGLLSTMHAWGRVDIARAVAVLAQGLPLLHLPRREIPSLTLGAAVLADVGPAMAPFRDDVDVLLDALEHVIGRSRLRLHRFETWPPALAADADDDAPPWQPPPRGTPVLVISDLGLTHVPAGVPRSRPATWFRFAQQLRRSGCPVAALLPNPRNHWPAPVTSHFAALALDQHCTARAARRAVERAWRV